MAYGLKSDPQGFLVGEIIENGRDLMRTQMQGIAIWKAIRTDVRAVKDAINSHVSTAVRLSRPGAVPRAAAASRAAGGHWRVSPSVVSPAGRSAPVQRRTAALGAVVVAQPRGPGGRFVAGQRTAGGGAQSNIDGGGSNGRMFGRMNDTLGKLASSLSAADNIDPTVNAMKEVKDVVSPLGRGLFSLFGRTAERKKEVWYRRFLKALTPGGQKTTQIVGGGGGGLFGGGGGLGGMLGGAGGSAAGGILGGLLGKGKGLLKGGGKLLKRLPIIGALLSGGMALGSAFGMDDDPSKSPEENRAQRYRGTGEAAGMGVGAIAGGAIGSLLGPIGTAVGAYLGSMLGEKIGGAVGEWTKSLVDSDVGGKVVQGWNVFTTGLGAAWDSLVTDAKATWGDITTKAGAWWDSTKEAAGALSDKVSSLADGMNSWFKDKTGLDVKQGISDAAGAVKGAASSGWDATKNAAGSAWTATKGAASTAADAAASVAAAAVPNTVKRAWNAGTGAATQAKAGYDEKRGNPTDTPAPKGALQQGARATGGAVGSAANWALGQTSKQYESGNGGAGTVSSGKGDHGGASYGTYQLSSNAGTLGKFLKQSPYGEQFAGLKPGSPEFNAKWKEVAKNDPNFGTAQHDFIKATHYDPMVAGLKKDGIDVEGGGAALKDAVWSTSVQFGGDSRLIQRALKGKDASKMSEAQKVTAIQDYKVANNEALFSKSSAAVRASTLARAKNENGSLQKLIAAGAGGGVAVASPTIPSPVPANIPSAVPATIPKPTEVKDVATPLNGAGAAHGSVSVSIPDTIGQNVGDRGTAHVVTGGIGGGSSVRW